ncbi:MAG: rRNA maturation RNase YbeY [Candidatus Aminicenantes bacterium]
MINVLNQQNKYWVDAKNLSRLLERLAAAYGHSHSEITLVLVDNRFIKKLNREYLNKDEPTDVLSFPIREKTPGGCYYLGDILISVPYAFEQCRRLSHGLEREIEMLCLHGFLHLCGYEHGAGLEEEEVKAGKKMLKGYHGY